MGWKKVEPAQVLPRHETGIDHGSKRFVLAHKGSLILVFQPGSKYWSSLMEPSAYAPCRLTILDLDERWPHAEVTLEKGGRLSKKVFERHKKKIDEAFGAGVSAHVDSRKRWTIVVSEGED